MNFPEGRIITVFAAKVAKNKFRNNPQVLIRLYIFMKILNLYIKCKIRKRMRKFANVMIAL